MKRLAFPLLLASVALGITLLMLLPPEDGRAGLTLFALFCIGGPLLACRYAAIYWQQVLMHKLRVHYFAGWRAGMRRGLAIFDPTFIGEVWRHMPSTELQRRMKRLFVFAQGLSLAGLSAFVVLLL